MTPHVDDRLYELHLGMLSPEEGAAVDAHLAECAACRAGVSEVARSLEMIPVALAPRPVPTTLRRRLIDAIEGPLRYLPFTRRVAALFDVSEPRSEELLRSVADPATEWIPGPVPGMGILPVDPGPSLRGTSTMFLRIEPTVVYPRHRHLGEERVLILEGSLQHDDGRLAVQGDLDVKHVGSTHSFAIPPGPTCVCASLLFEGADFVA